MINEFEIPRPPAHSPPRSYVNCILIVDVELILDEYRTLVTENRTPTRAYDSPTA
jgi:hypothetical protein